MEDCVGPDVPPEPEQEGKSLNPHRQSNKQVCKRQFAPASKAYRKKPLNRPNQDRKLPTPKSKSQNKTQIRDVPSYIRTEMEILKHLRHVNYNLKVLLKPRCHCNQIPRDYKCCQPAGERKEQLAKPNCETRTISRSRILLKQRKNGVASKGGTASKSDTASKRDAFSADITNRDSEVDANAEIMAQPNTKLINKHKSSGNGKRDVSEPQTPTTAPTKSQRTFQRFILRFKPKRKYDKSKCADVISKAHNEGKLNKEGDGKIEHQKYGLHRKHTPTLTRRASPRRVGQQRQDKKRVKNERTLKQKMLGSCLSCAGKESESVRKVEEKRMPKKEAKTAEIHEKAVASKREIVDTSTIERTLEVELGKTQQPVGESTVPVAEKLQKYLNLFKPRKKQPQPEEAVEDRREICEEFRLKKAQEKINSYETRHGLLSALNIFPKPSHIDTKYFENLKAYKKNEPKPERRKVYGNIKNLEPGNIKKQKPGNMKNSTDTPSSTSSLEEYFLRVSERMVRAQKEADERGPTHRKKRITNNNLYRRRGQLRGQQVQAYKRRR